MNITVNLAKKINAKTKQQQIGVWAPHHNKPLLQREPPLITCSNANQWAEASTKEREANTCNHRSLQLFCQPHLCCLVGETGCPQTPAPLLLQQLSASLDHSSLCDLVASRNFSIVLGAKGYSKRQASRTGSIPFAHSLPSSVHSALPIPPRTRSSLWYRDGCHLGGNALDRNCTCVAIHQINH